MSAEERENMSLVNANLAVPVNAAIAAIVLSENADATAGARADRGDQPEDLSL